MQSFSAASLIEFGQRVFTALGTPDDLAATVAASLVGANLAGHDSHGVIQLPVYARMAKEGSVLPAARASMRPANGMLATLVVDGALGWGPPAASLASEAIMERARSFGIGSAVVQRCHHIGRVGQYIERITSARLVGIVMVNAGRGVAPFGGAKSMLGTNPIAIGAPRRAAPPVMFDGSTSMVAGNKIRVLQDKGLPVPDGWIIDRNGQSSTRPQDLFEGGALLPLGGGSGHKGYGLSVMVEVLAGLLSGSSARALSEERAGGNGVMMIALNPEAFTTRDDFLDDIETLCAGLKASPAMYAGGEVLLPGEPEARTRAERENTGIPLPEATLQALRTLGDELDVRLN